MHFEILVEDQSGQIALESFLEKILGETHTYKIHPYGGIGKIPLNMKSDQDPKKRMLLTQLPRLLQGYGKAFSAYGPHYSAAVIVVCDLDNKDKDNFLGELNNVLQNCNPRPNTIFSLSIEEGEAWLLGDQSAVTTAYPGAKEAVLTSYKPDSICNTWELLADAIYPGGSQALKKLGFPHTGKAKCEWAEKISPLIDVRTNRSPSFQDFKNNLERLANAP